jgi:hypothetical protein
MATTLDTCRNLVKGWDGYDADPPSDEAIAGASKYLDLLDLAGIPPDRVASSVMGGVGVTHKLDVGRVYVEFLNDGQTYVLKSFGTEVVSMDIKGKLPAALALVRRILTGGYAVCE